MRKTIQTLLLTAMASAGIAIIAVTPSLAEQKEDRKRWSGKSHSKDQYLYHHSKPTFSELDLDGDGMITMENLADYQQQMFDAIDADNSGSLSKEEIENTINVRAMDHNTSMSSHMISSLDVDKDGVLSVTEFGSRHTSSKIFSSMDKNEDGSISAEEYDSKKSRMNKHKRNRHGKHRHNKE